MSNLSFVHEFNFTNGIFEKNIYDEFDVKDTIGDRQSIIENIIIEILTLFKNVPGLNIFSTFLNHNNIRYKITLINLKYK
jgi:hypothetical protein